MHVIYIFLCFRLFSSNLRDRVKSGKYPDSLPVIAQKPSCLNLWAVVSLVMSSLYFQLASQKIHLSPLAFNSKTRNAIFAGTHEAGATQNFAQQVLEALTFSDWQRLASHLIPVCLELSGFFSAAIRPTETYIIPRHDFSQQNNGLMSLIKQIRQAPAIFCGTKQSGVKAVLVRSFEMSFLQTKNKQTNKQNGPILRLGCRLASGLSEKHHTDTGIPHTKIFVNLKTNFCL